MSTHDPSEDEYFELETRLGRAEQARWPRISPKRTKNSTPPSRAPPGMPRR